MKEKLVQLFRKHKAAVLICSIILLVVFVVTSLLLGKKTTPKSDLVFSDSRVSKDTFVFAQDDTTYIYNGVGFYGINQNTRKKSKLAMIPDMPNVTSVLWGKSGAVVKLEGYSPNFTANYKGKLVNISEIASKEKFLVSEIKNVAWYIDFSTKQISFISLFESEQWAPVAYVDESDYFVLSATGLPVRQPLLTYSPNKSTPLGVIALPVKTSFASTVFTCGNNKSLCMNILDINGVRSLYRHPNNISLLKIKSGDSIYETTDRNKILIETQTQPKSENEKTTLSKNPTALEHIDEQEPIKSYELYDLSTNTKQKVVIPQEVTVAQPIGYSNGVLALFGDSVEGSKIIYSSQKTSGSLELKPALTPIDFVPISFVKFSSEAFVLKTNTGYVTALKNKITDPLVEQFNSVVAPNQLADCVKNTTPSFTDTRTIHISLDDSTATTLSQTRNCLYQQNSDPFSFSFEFEITKFRTGPVLN